MTKINETTKIFETTLVINDKDLRQKETIKISETTKGYKRHWIINDKDLRNDKDFINDIVL